MVCSFDKKPMDLKDLCIALRKNVVKLGSKSKSNEKLDSVVEFPNSAYDLLKKLLELDSDKRYSAEEALNHEFFKSD